jgi:hypothetical protein
MCRYLAWAVALILILLVTSCAAAVYYLGFVRHCGPFLCGSD